MSETMIINGQPQDLGNKMVTHDGLVDFLKMLKDEIPRMGLDNAMVGGYSYTFGVENWHDSNYSFLVGQSNLGSENFTYGFGYNNHLDAETSVVFGKTNYLGAGGVSGEIFIMGSNNGSEEQPIQGTQVFIMGNNNNNNNNESVLYAYGFGSHLTLTSDAVWLGQYNDPQESVVFGIGNGDSNKRGNLLTIDNSGGITLQNAHFNTEVAFQLGINLNNSLTLGPGKTTIIDYFGEVRHVLMPYNSNEGFWLVNNKDSPFHINFRQPYDSAGGYTQEETYHVPKEIHFHAGDGQGSWATIRCGNIHIGSEDPQITAENREIALLGNVTIKGSAKEDDSYTGALTCNKLTILRKSAVSDALGEIYAQGKVKGEFLESTTGKIVTENDMLYCCKTDEAPSILNCHSIQTQSFDDDSEIPFGTQLCFVHMRFDVVYHDSSSDSYVGNCYHSGLCANLNPLVRTYSWLPFNTSIPCTISNQAGSSIEVQVTPNIMIRNKKIEASATVNQYGATATVTELQYQIILTS